MAPVFEQFIRFGTDAVGIERFLRLVQALVQVTLFYRAPFDLLAAAVHLAQPLQQQQPDAAHLRSILAGVRARLGVARRLSRTFRFLESFDGARRLWAAAAPGTGGGAAAAALPAVLARSFSGMHHLLDTATLPDALGVDGLRPWGPHAGPALARESQRFWLLALVFATAAGLLRVAGLWAAAPPAPEGEGKGKDAEAAREARERERVARRRAVLRRLVADMMDLVLPGSALGYIKADSGVAGLAMVGSSILTGWEVWERCGREVDSMST